MRILKIPFQMTELNQIKNLKQQDRPDAVRKLYLTENKSTAYSTKFLAYVLQNRCS